jgi:hypothetical protein
MAGFLLDDLVDAFSDDEAMGPQDVIVEVKTTHISNAEEYFARALNMIAPHFQAALQNTVSPGSLDVDMTPEDKADYLRRMVHLTEMQEATPSADPELESSPTNTFLKGLTVLGGGAVQVCAEFRQTGSCRAGNNCGFVHEAPLSLEEINGSDVVNVIDPLIFETHSLQLPGCCKRVDSGLVTLIRDSYFA